MTTGYLDTPDCFLEVRVKEINADPGLIALCAGYEQGHWRCQQLAAHLCEWLPEFVLNHTELKSLDHNNAVRLVAKAARAVYTSQKYVNRGEIGELLLHIGIRQVFNTIPAISKYFFKDSSNDTVKGFDVVHVIATETELELWLGEAKFYKDVAGAISAAVEDLKKHSEREYLRSEFVAIVNKIDDNWPHADRLKKLLDKNTSLDQVFERMVIPVMIAYDSTAVGSFTEVSEGFLASFKTEIEANHANFASKKPVLPMRVQAFFLPLQSKDALLKAFDERLKAWQT